jgi:hypothetical protein
MDNAIGMIYRYKMPRECRFHFLFWILAPTAISAFLCGCSNDIGRAAYRPAPYSNPASIYRARAAEYATKEAKAAVAVKRAAYWKKRGYNFDPRELGVEGMDMIAAEWSPKGWDNFRANYYREEAARTAAARKAQKEFEAATAAATRATPPAPQKVETAPPPAPIAPIAPIAPRAKPLPAF